MAFFSAQKLQECLEDPKLFTSKYKEFKMAYAEHQQHIIHPSLCLLKTKLEQEVGHPMKKMHTLRAIKEAVDTGSYGVLQFVQAQILPIMEKVALFQSESQDPDRGKSLFLDKLKQQSLKAQYQKIGNSYFRYVLECIEVWATIKPYFVSGFEELENVSSGYTIIYKNLKKQGVSFYQKKSYYKVQDLGKKVYVESLKRLSSKPEEYSDYYSSVMTKALENQQVFKLPETQTIINMILIPDYLLQESTLKIIHKNLCNEMSHPNSKILSLQLLCQLFHCASISVLDFTQHYILPTLIKIIKSLGGAGKSLSKGAELFPNNPKLGQKLYHEILKTIILLGESCAKDPITGEETLLKKAYNQLNNSNYQLPMVVELSDFKYQYEQNLSTMKKINGLYKRKKQPPSVIVSIHQALNTNKRFVVPHFDSKTDIHEILSILKSIYNQFKSLSPDNQTKDQKWVNQAVKYLNLYNENIDSILEQNMNLSDFDYLTNEAYEFFQININICKELDHSVPYSKKLQAIRSIIKRQQTPQPPFIPSIPQIKDSSKPKAIQSYPSQTKVQNSQVKKVQIFQNHKIHDKSLSADLRSDVDFLPKSLVRDISYKKQQIPHQNKSLSSYDRKLQEKQKKEQFQVIAQYQKQHYNSRRVNFGQKSADSKSIINDILDNDIRSQTSEPQGPFVKSRLSESLISDPSKPKNKIGMRRINDSQSFEDSRSIRMQQPKKNDLLFIKQSIIQSKSIDGSKNIIDKNKIDNNSQQLFGNNNNIFGMGDSFGNPAFVSKNQRSQLDSRPFNIQEIKYQQKQMDFKKKSKVNMSVGGDRDRDRQDSDYKRKDLLDSQYYNGRNSIAKSATVKQPQVKTCNFMKRSKVQSKNQSVVMSKSQIKHLKAVTYQQESEIIEPGIEPANNSYYEPQFQLKQQILKVTSTDTPQFNDCFQAQKYLIPSKTFGGEAKKYWLQQEAKMLTTFNKSIGQGSIKSQVHSTLGGVSVPQIIAEHNKHFQVQMQGIRDQHRKQISFLENKIRKLQRSNKDQQKTLNEQKSQIQSLRGGVNSEINFGATLKSNQKQFLQSENMILRSRLQNQTKSNYQSKNFSPIKTLTDPFIHSRDKFNKIPKGDIFPSQPYQEFLQMLSDMNLKKQMIKNKDLLLKNQNLQVGFISSRENNCVRVALFFQSQSKQLVDIRLNLNNKGLKLQTYPQEFPRQIKHDKQQRYVIALFVTNSLKIPYEVPQINLTFKIKQKNQTVSLNLPVPLTFNRLLSYSEIDPVKFKQIYKQNAQYITRGEEIAYNKKILKDIPSFKQTLPKLQIINPYKEAEYLEGNSTIKFGVRASYQPFSSQFLIKINIKPGGFLYFQTIPLTKPSTNRIPEQFFICTMNHLLRKQRLW